jgi:ribosomal subunit interface protein
MLQKFEIGGVHASVDKDLKDYVNRKLGGLDHYMSRHSRNSAHGEVFLKESKAKNKASFTCELTLQMPHQTIVVKESGLSMYAAVDMTEAASKIQLKKYKDKHDSSHFQRHVIGRFKRKQA